MRISFSPQRRDDALVLEQTSVDRLSINGELYDFATLPDGATIPVGAVPCDWIVGPVERIEGDLRLTLILPHRANPEPSQAHPEPIAATDLGPIDIPTDTTVEVEEMPVEGGINIVTTIRRWHQEPEVETVFVPDPPAPENTEEEPADVDA